MFDPHRIGPRRSSSYARNKGRVIQRKLVNTPSPGYTRSELEQLVPLMQKNGLFPSVPAPSPNFGRMVRYSVLLAGTDISNNYVEINPNEIGEGEFEIDATGEYLLVIPNVEIREDATTYVNTACFLPFTAVGTGMFIFSDMTEGSRLYQMGDNSGVDTVVLYGENGTFIKMYVGHGRNYDAGVPRTIEDGAIFVPM